MSLYQFSEFSHVMHGSDRDARPDALQSLCSTYHGMGSAQFAYDLCCAMDEIYNDNQSILPYLNADCCSAAECPDFPADYSLVVSLAGAQYLSRYNLSRADEYTMVQGLHEYAEKKTAKQDIDISDQRSFAKSAQHYFKALHDNRDDLSTHAESMQEQAQKISHPFYRDFAAIAVRNLMTVSEEHTKLALTG